MYDPTDAATARLLLEDALALTTKPTLETEQVDRAFGIASSLDTDGVTVIYTAADLDRAAVWGWNVKAGLTSDQYDLGGQGGSKLTRSQWQAACERMADRFNVGRSSVTGETLRSGRGIASITLSTDLSESYLESIA